MAMLPCILSAQSVATLIGARANGLGNASACLSDEWSLFNNVAGLSKISNAITAFSYDSRPKLIGADKKAMVFASPIKKVGVAALGVFHFGDNLYSEQIISAGYSNSYGLISLGIKMNYVQYRAQGFKNGGVFSISAGTIAQLTPHLAIGIHATNINQPNLSKFKSEKEYLPTLLIAGIGYKASDNVFITTEIEKDLSYKYNLKAGIEYQAHKKLIFRTGFNLQPSTGYFGMGFKLKKFTLDYAYCYEPTLGGSHQATVGYIIKKK